MKKNLLFLLFLGVILIAPFKAFAALSPSISGTPVKEETLEDGKLKKVYEVYIITSNNEAISNAEFSFSYKNAITKFTCGDAGDFVLDSQTSTGSNTLTCKFAVPSGQSEVSGEKILVGNVTIIVNPDASDEDCAIDYSFNGSEGKINPETGISVPYAVITTGLVAAGGIYLITRKKSKLQRI